MKNKIFISFSSKDIEKIQAVITQLDQNHIPYWICHNNIGAGAQYAQSIVDGIKECDIFAVFLSKNSNISQHVTNEINIAVMYNKIIIPIILDDVKLSPAMEYYISCYQWIHWDICDVPKLLVKRALENPMIGTSSIMHNIENKELTAEDLFQKGRDCFYGTNETEINFEDAVYWYRKAANMGHSGAANNLGWCYETGSGVSQNWNKSYQWYVIAANAGNPIAKYSIGWMYQHGIYLKKNLLKAFQYYTEAAELDYPIAQYKVGIAYQEGIFVDMDMEKANYWFQKSAEQSNVAAMYRLAENYFFGRGCKQDIIKAKNMWLLSSEMGYSRSQDALEKYYDIFYNADKKSFDI